MWSPAKSKPWWDPEDQDNVADMPEVSEAYVQQNTDAGLADPLASFPTSGQFISDTTLKDMLWSLRASLQTHLLAGLCHCRAEVEELGHRVDQVEEHMSEFASSFNTMVDAQEAHSEELHWIKSELAEETTLKCTVSQNLSPNLSYRTLCVMFFLLLSLTFHLQILQLIESIKSRSHLTYQWRSPMMYFLEYAFFKLKKKLLDPLWWVDSLPQKIRNLQIFPDFCQYTMQWHNNLFTITKAQWYYRIQAEIPSQPSDYPWWFI